MNKEQRDVLDFSVVTGQHVRQRPGIPPSEVVTLRIRLVTEEFAEFIGAITGMTHEETLNFVKFLHGVVWRKSEVDLALIADAIADLKYVLEGTNLSFGIDGEPIWDAVHAANMKKVSGPIDVHGKRLKPPGWTPPDIRGELEKQGIESPEGES